MRSPTLDTDMSVNLSVFVVDRDLDDNFFRVFPGTVESRDTEHENEYYKHPGQTTSWNLRFRNETYTTFYPVWSIYLSKAAAKIGLVNANSAATADKKLKKK